MAELRRATIRIISNYVRLAATFVLGFYLVRALLDALGTDGSGLVFLLGSTVGIVAMVEEAASWSMIRELGTAHHSGDRQAFLRMFNSALALSLAATVFVLIGFGVLLALLPWMDIDANLLPAARWFVIAKAVETAALVSLSPQFNMYLVTERMVAYNFWLTMRRVSAVLGVFVVYWLTAAANPDPARGLIIYGWATTGFMILALLLAVTIITVQDRRLVPALSMASRSGLKSLLGISGWNIGIQSSQTLAFPVGAIIMNSHFGLIANMTYGVGYTLSGYTRQLASGMNMGLDAVAARISTDRTSNKMPVLVRYSTMLHGLAIFPAVAYVGALAHPILELWIGAKVTPGDLDTTATLTRIMLISMGIICLCDCWTRILFGAGFVQKYAPALIIGNICTPIVALLFMAIFPAPQRYTAVVWAIAAIYGFVYLGWVPHKTAQSFGMRYWEVLSPLARPLAAALICSPLLWVFANQVHHWNLWRLGAAGAGYGTAYLLAAWYFVLPAADRSRLAVAARLRFLPGKAA